MEFKHNSSLKQLLVKPKDQDPKEKKSGVIYSYQCRAMNCNFQDSGGKIQGALEGTLAHQGKQPTNWPQLHTGQFQHHRERGPGPSQDYKRIYLHQSKQFNPQ